MPKVYELIHQTLFITIQDESEIQNSTWGRGKRERGDTNDRVLILTTNFWDHGPFLLSPDTAGICYLGDTQVTLSLIRCLPPAKAYFLQAPSLSSSCLVAHQA
jgi:hypothetical protein